MVRGGIIPMIYIEMIAAVILIIAVIHFLITKKRNNYQAALIADHMNASEELKKTLAMGIYFRFSLDETNQDETDQDADENQDQYSDSFIKEDPLMFEDFVADIIERARGGITYVIPTTNEIGVNLEHKIDEEKYLGLVKYCKEDLAVEPIAILHSNIVKYDAIGGYVITTSDFTEQAKQYAAELEGIELISGLKLVDLWLEGLQNYDKEVSKVAQDLNNNTSVENS